MEAKLGQIEGTKLGNLGAARTVCGHAQERAALVLGDPLVLKQAGAAVPLLAAVNERCGDRGTCRLRYSEVATALSTSLTTIKSWAETLERLGFFTRQPCGPAGVEIRLNPERWPSNSSATALHTGVTAVVGVLNALRVAVDAALRTAVADVERLREAA